MSLEISEEQRNDFLIPLAKEEFLSKPGIQEIAQIFQLRLVKTGYQMGRDRPFLCPLLIPIGWREKSSS